MTYHSDPTRWSQSQLSSSDQGSELLRDAFSAGTREGPSDLQMRALALKLAAVGTGVAVTATAATAYGTHAGVTAAGGALKSAGAFTLSKLAVSIALVGAAATAAVLLQRGAEVPERARAARQQVVQQQTTAPSSAADTATVAARAVVTAPAVTAPAVAAPVVAPAVVAPAQARPAQPRNAPEQADRVTSAAAVEVAPRAQATELDTSVNEAPSSRSHQTARVERHAARADTDTHTKSSRSITIVSKSEHVAGHQLSEIELLRSARASLAAQPREAYRLAEQHKELYPQGVFAQERDALAVEALQRAGDLKLARQRAQAFVQRYPSSPHAHRFRETMGL
jgi:hypothetical protein